MKLRLPRGIRDIDPDKYSAFRYVYNKFLETADLYGFKVMEPATIEMFETLALKSGPNIEKEIYAFEDKAGRRLGLRFDLTIGLTRYVVSNPSLSKPVKLGAFSVQWRYDEPQYGRYRSFYAWDVEVYGADEDAATIEVSLFIDELMRKVGLDTYEFRFSDRRLVEKMITAYLKSRSTDEIMRIIDKLQKLRKEEIVELMEQMEIDRGNAESFIDLLAESRRTDSVYKIIDEVGYEGPLTSVLDSLSRLGVPSMLDLSIVRGLDYYDGIVFEIYDTDNLNIGALCGGGTYNRLPRIFGSDLTAVGAAGGVERLILSLEKHGNESWKEKRVKTVYVAVVDKSVISYAFKVAQVIRRKGFSCDVNLSEKKLKRQLELASRRGIDYVVIIGGKEADAELVTIRDMKKEEQESVKFDELEAYLDSITDV